MPGVHTKLPFLTQVLEVTVRPSTDTLEPISGVTKDGITNEFKNVQVNQLDF
jgi:hypothetical protein